ncbi:Uncharacterised protein [Mycobacteroides abscessus subsp. abscessus]|nr:Uncharacterised protein [Mycobacteroides abscessus subsp. abscessus]
MSLDARHIGPGVGLGHRDRRDLLTAQGRSQELALELITAVFVQRGGGHRDVNPEGHRKGPVIHPAEFLGKDQREEVIRSLSAVFGVVFQADESELGHIGDHLVQRHHLLAFPLIDAGVDLFLDVPADSAAKVVVFGRERHRSLLV